MERFFNPVPNKLAWHDFFFLSAASEREKLAGPTSRPSKFLTLRCWLTINVRSESEYNYHVCNLQLKFQVLHFNPSGSTETFQGSAAASHSRSEAIRYLPASSLRPSLFSKVTSETLFTRQSVSQGCVRSGTHGSLFITAGAERCGALTFGRVG